jgi:hypothetical protein
MKGPRLKSGRVAVGAMEPDRGWRAIFSAARAWPAAPSRGMSSGAARSADAAGTEAGGKRSGHQSAATGNNWRRVREMTEPGLQTLRALEAKGLAIAIDDFETAIRVQNSWLIW